MEYTHGACHPLSSAGVRHLKIRRREFVCLRWQVLCQLFVLCTVASLHLLQDQVFIVPNARSVKINEQYKIIGGSFATIRANTPLRTNPSVICSLDFLKSLHKDIKGLKEINSKHPKDKIAFFHSCPP